MSDNVYIGRRCASVSKPLSLKPISKVVLWVDNNICYEAGDASGREFEITCPYGTQKMAEDLLNKLGGYAYQPVTADDALLDPAAELGDAVTVDSCYTLMASMDLTFDGLLAGNISAPGSSELPQEYSLNENEKILNRKIARTRSYIKKSVDELRLEVFGEEGSGEEASLAVKLDQITQEVKGAIGVDEETGKLLPVSSSINLALGDITAKVEGAIGVDEDGNLLPVSSSVKLALGEAIIDVSNGAESSTFTLKIGGAEIKSPEIKMTGVVTFSGLESGKTTINGAWLETETVKTDALHLEGMLTVYDGPDSDTPGGYIGFDAGFNKSSGIGMRRYAPDRYGNTQGPQVVCTNKAARISFTSVAGQNTSDTSVVCQANSLALTGNSLIQMAIGGNVLVDLDTDGFYSASSTLTLGTQDHKWSDVYAAGTSFSSLVARVAALEAK